MYPGAGMDGKEKLTLSGFNSLTVQAVANADKAIQTA